MDAVIELRDLELARRYVVEGLWLQQALRPIPRTVRSVLELAMEVASGGNPLPPVGFIADVGHVALGADSEHRGTGSQVIAGWPSPLIRSYEDHVLGKLYADWAFERAGDAIRKYKEADRKRGLAYLVNRIRERAEIPGVLLPPAIIRALINTNPEEVLQTGLNSLMRERPLPLFAEIYASLITAIRRVGVVLEEADILALEQRTALADMSEYVAHRQILQITAKLEEHLPARPVKPLIGRKEVPTRIHDEDQYPVGGYTSIATRGSIESILHSQLAYMEPHPPDLFDVKFVRDELFYYSRDENQFLRRRRSFAFVLFSNLVQARFKDAELPCQRIVLVQSLILSLIRKLNKWLSNDAIRFDVLFVKESGTNRLAEEANLMRVLLRELIERGDASVIEVADKAEVNAFLNGLARKSQVHCLAAATEPFAMEMEHVVVTELVVAGSRPAIGSGDGLVAELEGEDAFDVWCESALRVLQLWV